MPKKPPPKAESDHKHFASGAPKDEAHAAVGDGTLQGAVPAGLSPDELAELARRKPTDNAGTG